MDLKNMSFTELKKFMLDRKISIINSSNFERKGLLIKIIFDSITKTILNSLDNTKLKLKLKEDLFTPKFWMKSDIDFDTITLVISEHPGFEFYKLERNITVGVKHMYFRYCIENKEWNGGIYYDPNKVADHMWFNPKCLDNNFIRELNLLRNEILNINDTIHIIRTPFEDLCSSIKNVDLIELTGEKLWIKDIILDLNKMGFYTLTSQPGEIINNFTTFKTAYDRKYNVEENIISNTDVYCRKQRAYIRGYMESDMATFIINKLIDDKFVYARSANHNEIDKLDNIHLGSVIFKNDNPIIHEMSDEMDMMKVPDACEAYNLSIPLHRPLMDIDNIVEFDIVDRRWDTNDYMWNKLYDLIKEYYSL
jgi:hypothetical protein